jgi:hypothetical protein
MDIKQTFNNLLDETQIDQLVSIAIEGLSFSDQTNYDFSLYFRDACQICGIEFKLYNTNSYVSGWKVNRKKDKMRKQINQSRKHKQRQNTNVDSYDVRWVHWYFLSPPDPVVTYSLEYHEATAVLIYIVSSDWINKVTSVNQIPSTLLRALASFGVSINTLFANVRDSATPTNYIRGNPSEEIEPYVHYVLPIERIYRQRSIQLSPPIRSAPDTEDVGEQPTKRRKKMQSEYNDTTSDVSDMMNYVSHDRKSLALMSEESRVEIIPNEPPVGNQPRTASTLAGVHPYMLSAYLFCEGRKLVENGVFGSERLAYQSLLAATTGDLESDVLEDCGILKTSVQHIKSNIAKYSKDTRSNDATVDTMRLVSEMLYRAHVKDIRTVCGSAGRFMPIHSKRRREDGRVTVSFPRDSVSPLDALTSMKVIEMRYMPWTKRINHCVAFTGDNEYGITFDDRDTTIVMSDVIADELFERVNYQLCANHYSMARNSTPSPIFPYVVRSFASFDPFNPRSEKNLLSSMKIILKWFDRSKVNRSEGWPVLGQDGLCQFYMMLPVIMNRFKSRDVINDSLRKPYTSGESIRYTKCSSSPKVSGFKDEIPNIYTAIKSLCYMRNRHSIFSCTIEKLRLLFITNPDMEAAYPIQSKIVDYLYDCVIVDEEDLVEIPFTLADINKAKAKREKNRTKRAKELGKEMSGTIPFDDDSNNRGCDKDVDYYDYDDNDDNCEWSQSDVDNTNHTRGVPNDDYQTPCHISLYYLCCDTKYVSDETAIEIFINTILVADGRIKLTLSAPHPHVGNMIGVRLMSDSFLDNMRKHSTDRVDSTRTPSEYEVYNGLRILTESLEQLSYHPVQSKQRGTAKYRGEVALDQSWHAATLEEMCKEDLPCIPLQFDSDGMPQSSHQLFPVWKSEVYDRDVVPKHKVDQSDVELLPLTGCHRDLLESIILTPCTQIRI